MNEIEEEKKLKMDAENVSANLAAEVSRAKA